MKILYTSNDIHKTVKNIFKTDSRRIAIVAYIGANADKYLPNPNNIEIICCPEPGATNPASLRVLIERGAKIKFSDGLHSKVYWSEKGCIITSANISYRALGSYPQKEAGILFCSDLIDIERLIKESAPYEITQEAMNKLDIEHRKLSKNISKKAKKTKANTFLDWYKSPYRELWKLGWWRDSDLETSISAKEKSFKEYNIIEPEGVLNIQEGQVTEGDWLLCFEIYNSKIKSLEWMYVDLIVKVSPNDKKSYEKEYPYQAIQVFKLTNYPSPPFEIKGSFTKAFKKAFKKAAKEYGTSKIETTSSLVSPKELTKKVYEAING